MKCLLTVKGNGHGGHGVPKRDRTELLVNFLVDNTVFYKAVRDHVKTCDKCDPVEILEHYFKRRMTLKNDYSVSRTLVVNACQYEKMFRKTSRPIPESLVKKFMIHSSAFMEFSQFLTSYEVCQAIFHMHSHPGNISGRLYNRLDEAMKQSSVQAQAMRALIESSRKMPEPDELEDLLAVCDVMAS